MTYYIVAIARQVEHNCGCWSLRAVVFIACNSSAIPRRFPSVPSLQLPSGQEVSEILQQMCGEISHTTTVEIVEVANYAAPRSKLQDLLPVYFYSWQLQSPEAVIIHLLLHYFILWRDGSKRREVKEAFEEYIEQLKSRVAELEKSLYESRTEVHRMKAELEEKRGLDPRLAKQVQALKLAHGKLLRAHDEVSVSSVFPSDKQHAELIKVTNPWPLNCLPQLHCMTPCAVLSKTSEPANFLFP